MTFFERGGPDEVLNSSDLRNGLYQALDAIGKRKKVLLIPPDITRIHSRAGDITALAYRYYRNAVTDILPALGTHTPMTRDEIFRMFPGVPLTLFREHKWRTHLTTLGFVPGSYIAELSNGRIQYDWPAQVNSLIVQGHFDLVLSLGQVVPHEVVGMANHAKNLFIGTGGAEGIHKSHFLGAVHGMEQIMGRIDSPVRAILDYASKHFTGNIPIIYVLTVLGPDSTGAPVLRGLYIGDDRECYTKAARLSKIVNITTVKTPIKKCVVYLDPVEFRSTWLGNKAVYRSRMALQDGAELLILAPGLQKFGEDAEMDSLIRRFGYRGMTATLNAADQNTDLAANLAVAAHLIHGSSEGRFTIRYASGILSRQEIESVGLEFAELDKALKKYCIQTMKNGWNTVDDEEIFFISNPATGLWTHPNRH